MKYALLAVVMLLVGTTVWDPKSVYVRQPAAVLVGQAKTFHVERTGNWIDGTVELIVPPSVTGFVGGLVNDTGPCYTYYTPNTHLVCYPQQTLGHIIAVGFIGPHTSPMPVTGIATDKFNKETDTKYLVIGGSVSSNFPLLAP